MDKTKEKIYRSYTSWVLDNNRRPEFIEAFVIEAEVGEESFRKYFDSFQALEKSFWSDQFEEAVLQASQQPEFRSYSVNEKLLSFYFTWMEVLKSYRSYVIHVFDNLSFYEIYPSEFEFFKKRFEVVIGNLISEGRASGEIADRPWISDKYQYLLWTQPLAILRFWVKDTSANFENTDALIEKTVNLSFDLMRSNSLDSFVDLAKFHLQHMKHEGTK